MPYFKIWIAPVLLTGALESSIVIINKNIYHVVIAIRDPHPRVNGEGIRILKAGGIRITEGVEEYPVRRSLEDW